MRITAPGLSGHQAAMAASAARIMFLIVPLVTVAEVLRAYLNARYAFIAPAAMNVVMNGLAATCIVAGVGSGHRNVHLLGWAYVAGAAAQLVAMAVMAWRRGLRYRPVLLRGAPEMRAVGKLCLRPTVGAGLNPVARVGEQLFVSFLPPGSITILNYGYRLISSIGGTVFFRSVVVALVPRLTQATAEHKEDRVLSTTALGVRIMLVLSVPLTAIMAVLARPAALVVFRRGNFARNDAVLLGIALAVYAASLVGSAVQRALLAPFFARLDTRTPLRNTVYGVVANLVLLPLLVLPFGSHNPRAILGVALAYSLAQYVNVFHAWHRLRVLVGTPRAMVRPLLVRLVVASTVAAAVMVVGYDILHLGSRQGRWALLGRTTLDGLAGLAGFALLLALAGPVPRPEPAPAVASGGPSPVPFGPAGGPGDDGLRIIRTGGVDVVAPSHFSR
jgi:murein biosynthesis integral membrane protein MurJ